MSNLEKEGKRWVNPIFVLPPHGKRTVDPSDPLPRPQPTPGPANATRHLWTNTAVAVRIPLAAWQDVGPLAGASTYSAPLTKAPSGPRPIARS